MVRDCYRMRHWGAGVSDGWKRSLSVIRQAAVQCGVVFLAVRCGQQGTVQRTTPHHTVRSAFTWWPTRVWTGPASTTFSIRSWCQVAILLSNTVLNLIRSSLTRRLALSSQPQCGDWSALIPACAWPPAAYLQAPFITGYIEKTSSPFSVPEGLYYL